MANDEKSEIAKYSLLAIMVLVGSSIQVLMSNQKQRLNRYQNLTIFLCGCLVGGSWGYYYYNHKDMLMLTGFVSICGYHLVNVLVLIAKDPNILKNIIKEKISKL